MLIDGYIVLSLVNVYLAVLVHTPAESLVWKEDVSSTVLSSRRKCKIGLLSTMLLEMQVAVTFSSLADVLSNVSVGTEINFVQLVGF